jgi:hypothetical protein
MLMFLFGVTIGVCAGFGLAVGTAIWLGGEISRADRAIDR